jgi:hypothetical protein
MRHGVWPYASTDIQEILHVTQQVVEVKWKCRRFWRRRCKTFQFLSWVEVVSEDWGMKLNCQVQMSFILLFIHPEGN